MGHLLLISINSNKIITAFSWMLIHSLWQGLLLAVVAGVVLMLTKRSSAAYRYNLMLTLFIAFIGVCAYTFIAEWNIASKTVSPLAAGDMDTNVSSLFSGNLYNLKPLIKAFSDYFSANAPMIVLIWFVVFLFKSVKMIACLVYNNRIRNFQVYEPDQFWIDAVESFSKKLGIKKAIRLVQSGYIKIPVVVGHLKPIIIIPVGLMAGLPVEQVEAILLHELAHIRRNDYFINFLQNIAETIFFFNPGLLWISTLLREERENCCDDIALEQTQNRVGFVQALISFKEHELYGSKYATAFPGKKNYLFRRISRILNNKSMTFASGEKIFLMVSVILLAFALGTVALGQVKDKLKGAPIKIQYKAAHDSIPTDSLLANRDAVRAIAPLKHKKMRHNEKMQDGIVDITTKSARLADTELSVTIKPAVELARIKFTDAKQPVEPIQAKKQPVVSVKQLTEADQKLSKKYKELTDRQRSEMDQIQAKKDQQQALIDQEQAVKDQAQARIDQTQAIKDQDQTRKQKQDADNDQARLNEIQAKKNHEQEIRNKEQARLNEIQAQRNHEQEIRNREQGRLNEIQAQKNQERALKNNVSVQQ
ncbi:MAG TPA: M56 family metallopeptidase [Mucilaginibacter sp.]|jgi:beta-lactamase regulating signal transducer with metallopeptidase domain